MKNLSSVLTLCILFCCRISLAQPGTLDSSFGTNGEVSTKIMMSSDAKSVAIQPDGKILVAGSSNDRFTDNFALARYNPDGTRDNSFGLDGKVTTDFGGEDYGMSVLVQPDSKIIVAGYSYNGSNDNFALARYTRDGNLDPGFGKNGKLITDFGGDDFGLSVALAANGKVVVAGYNYTGTNYEFLLSQYLADGTKDGSFGRRGKVTTNLGGSNAAYSVAVQANGKIVVAGTSYPGYDFIVARFHMNGRIDSAFGTGGKVSTDFGGYDNGQSVAIQPDGKIVVAGFSNDNFALARYRRNGNLDKTFGINGKVTTDLGGYDYGQSVTIQTDGKILLAGFTLNGTDYDFSLVRYMPDGTRDQAFGADGKVTTDFGSDDYSFSIAVQADGKILETGSSNSEFTLVRYNGDDIASAKTGNSDAAASQAQVAGMLPNVRLFPNPVNDILNIRGMSSSEKSITIVDLTGRELQRAVTANNDYSFNVKQLPAGMYFIRIDEGKKTSQLRFMK